MKQLPVAMPKTIRAIDVLLRSASPADSRNRLLDLLLAAAAVECHVNAADSAEMVPALLRDMVIIATRVAGRGWLEANADTAAAFIALHASLRPPPLGELDDIVARLLADRFGLSAQQQPQWAAHSGW